MSVTWRFGLLSAGTIVGFDVIASLLSRSLHISYTRFSIGSYVLYGLLGYLAAQRATPAKFKASLTTGRVAGATDCTLGWYIATLLHPFAPQYHFTPALWILTAIVVTITASFFAVIGFFAARILTRGNRVAE
jgi:hypothetical protein